MRQKKGKPPGPIHIYRFKRNWSGTMIMDTTEVMSIYEIEDEILVGVKRENIISGIGEIVPGWKFINIEEVDFTKEDAYQRYQQKIEDEIDMHINKALDLLKDVR